MKQRRKETNSLSTESRAGGSLTNVKNVAFKPNQLCIVETNFGGIYF